MAARVLSGTRKLCLLATTALHGAWPEGLSSSSRGILRPERPAPLHRMPVSVNTSPDAAVLLPGSTHYRRFGTLVPSPPHPAGLRGEAPLPEGHGDVVPKGFGLESADLLPSPDTGVIRPDIGSYRAGTVDGLPRLPVITQTSFFSPRDIKVTNWVTPSSFMDKNPAVMAINLPRDDWTLHADNPLINRNDISGLMLTPAAKIMWQSLIDLVVANRARGYCISDSLREDNLLVSSVTGQFALRRAVVDELPEYPSKFVGFNRVKQLFVDLMVHHYGGSVIELLTDDVSHLLDTLDEPDELNGLLARGHPCFMSDEGWSELVVRIYQFLTVELDFCHEPYLWKATPNVLGRLAELYEDVDVGSMHPFFDHWLQHAARASNAAQGQIQGWRADPVMQRGRQVLAMHRHALLHSHSWRLYKLAKKKRFTKKHVIELLQFKCPLCIPEAVRVCKDNEVWNHLKIDNCYKKTMIYPKGC